MTAGVPAMAVTDGFNSLFMWERNSAIVIFFPFGWFPLCYKIYSSVSDIVCYKQFNRF